MIFGILRCKKLVCFYKIYENLYTILDTIYLRGLFREFDLVQL